MTNVVMQAIAFRTILASGEYPDDMREWQNLTPAEQMWYKWKTKVLIAYAAKEMSDKARDAVGQTFCGEAIAQVLPQQV